MFPFKLNAILKISFQIYEKTIMYNVLWGTKLPSHGGHIQLVRELAQIHKFILRYQISSKLDFFTRVIYLFIYFQRLHHLQ